MTNEQIKSLIKKLTSSSAVIGNLPELPGYNGAILKIDDDEAERIERDLDEVADALASLMTEENTVGTEKQESFRGAALPLIKWLCENVHPHHSVIVTPTNAELLEGQCTTGTVLDYVKD